MITQETLDSIGITAKDAGSEWVMECPYCGKPDHLYLNKTTSLFKCHRCGEAGGWARLRKEYGATEGITPPPEKKYTYPTEDYVIQCQKKLLGPGGTAALEYLASRKIDTKLVMQFKLGLDKKDGNPVVCIPIYEDGKPVNIKYRSIPPREKHYTRYAGGKTALFNGDVLKNVKDEEIVFITEGEIDAMTLVSMGYTAVGVTGGAETIQSDWIDRLAKVKHVYIAYDNDQSGESGAKKLAKRLGLERCYRVKLPTKDANQFVADGHTKEEFQQCVEEAEQFGVDNVCTTLQAFIELTKEYDRNTDDTALYPPWGEVRRLTGAFEPGDLVVLSAPPKVGKTTFALNMALSWASQGHPVLFYCLEMRPARLVRQAIKRTLRKEDRELTPQVLLEGYKEMAEWPIYWGYNHKKLSPDIVFETMREAYKRYGIEAIVFDNLHYLARDITHQVQEVSYISRTMKLIAEELEIPLILIAQPRKIGRNAVAGIEDLKDSSSIGADADHVIILHRDKTTQKSEAEASFKAETLVRVDASRFHAGGETFLYYDGAKALFTPIARL